MARDMARQEALKDLVLSIQELPLDSSHSVYEKMRVDPDFRDRMGRVRHLVVTRSIRPGSGQVMVELAVPLLGKNGLLSLIANESYGRRDLPVFSDDGPQDTITGIIIDLRQLNHFETSLEPGVYTDQGRKFYGPEFVDPAATTGRGPVAYHSTVEEARNDDRVGLNPYYVFASGARGKYRSDVFIDGSDARRILSSESGRRALRNGAVVFVL